MHRLSSLDKDFRASVVLASFPVDAPIGFLASGFCNLEGIKWAGGTAGTLLGFPLDTALPSLTTKMANEVGSRSRPVVTRW